MYIRLHANDDHYRSVFQCCTYTIFSGSLLSGRESPCPTHREQSCCLARVLLLTRLIGDGILSGDEVYLDVGDEDFVMDQI